VPAVLYIVWAVSKHPHQLDTAPIALTLSLLMGAVTGLIA
jgi:hypothetical protein